MSEFFGGTDSFENIFGKSIFMVMENLEQVLYLLCHAYYGHAYYGYAYYDGESRAGAGHPNLSLTLSLNLHPHLEQMLVTSWDAIGCMLLLQLNSAQRSLMNARQLPLLSSFFQRVQASRRTAAPPHRRAMPHRTAAGARVEPLQVCHGGARAVPHHVCAQGTRGGSPALRRETVPSP